MYVHENSKMCIHERQTKIGVRNLKRAFPTPKNSRKFLPKKFENFCYFQFLQVFKIFCDFLKKMNYYMKKLLNLFPFLIIF